MEETISLKELFQTIRKRLSLIILLTVVVVATVGVISFFFLTPVYSSTSQIIVNQSKNEQQTINTGEIQTNLQLINTYSIIIKTPAILDVVKEELNLDRSTGAINSQISVANEQNSQVVNITVQDTDPRMAADIANTVASVFQKEIVTIMNVDNVQVLSPAVVAENQSPVKPQPVLNMAIGLVVGLMLGVGLAFLLEYLDNTIKNEQDIEKLLELPVLGAITTIDMEAETANIPSQKSFSRVRSESVGS
ncbi:YveK family protein [Fredinandcohnia onubensis]|uniref:YveK family protein n=1 Tax=Fredinandcohnia onubensis TaxID=1571209 RepID=UPI000C0BC50B|nr:Wzz/FepE/Etk N-terminal domain-containing protein [Fredinandcohnia onubensis]